jgi:hypothetical protein
MIESNESNKRKWLMKGEEREGQQNGETENKGVEK